MHNHKSSRRTGRSKAFQVLYSLHFTPTNTIMTLQSAFLNIPKVENTVSIKNVSQLSGFAWELVEGVWRNTHDIDIIISHFSENWRVDRLGKIELTLLRIAMFEILYRPDVPPKVALNEALELTSYFGDTKAKKFINGILDAVIKALEAGTLTMLTTGKC